MIWIFNIQVFIFSKIKSQSINHDFDLFGGAKKLSLNPYWQITETKSKNREITHRVLRKQNPEKF